MDNDEKAIERLDSEIKLAQTIANDILIAINRHSLNNAGHGAVSMAVEMVVHAVRAPQPHVYEVAKQIVKDMKEEGRFSYKSTRLEGPVN